MFSSCIIVLLFAVTSLTAISTDIYTLDDSAGLGRRFDGIGGLSGGGATSKLLVNYKEPFRSQILDYLFKPNFAASLQILKVEIGGDAQSTDGTESSHMHTAWDESYDRGYEWWLMVEAKKRNPDIKLYGLPWAFPGWLGDRAPYGNPNRTADYITKWVAGAQKHYNLTIDYIGIWNERMYNVEYVKVLRDVLDRRGYHGVSLVVADGNWIVSKDVLADPVFAKAVGYIGAHYPGTESNALAMETSKPLWSSEDYSTINNNRGAGCWARILNQNYVNGHMTSTISWNLIASYYQDLPYGRDGLMTAQEPWSGHYTVEAPIWVTAHTTMFTSPGWHYLPHRSGVGTLQRGGSYVSLVDLMNKHLTIIIETMSHNHSYCIRPKLPPYDVENQLAVFQLRGDLMRINRLYVWGTKLRFDGTPDVLFQPFAPVLVNNGTFKLHLGVDELYTLTTMYRPPPRLYPPPPPSQPFPIPYMDDFEAYPLNSEAYNFVPQGGVWEVRESGDKGHGKVNRQVVTDKPCYWCDTGPHPINIGGNYKWTDVEMTMDVRLPAVNSSEGLFLATRVAKGGCGVAATKGIFFSVTMATNEFRLTSDLQMEQIILNGTLKTPLQYDVWYEMKLITWQDTAYGYLNSDQVFMMQIPVLSKGFVGYGSGSYGIADFDNLNIVPA